MWIIRWIMAVSSQYVLTSAFKHLQYSRREHTAGTPFLQFILLPHQWELCKSYRTYKYLSLSLSPLWAAASFSRLFHGVSNLTHSFDFHSLSPSARVLSCMVTERSSGGRISPVSHPLLRPAATPLKQRHVSSFVCLGDSHNPALCPAARSEFL